MGTVTQGFDTGTNPSATGEAQWRAVVCSPERLRIHPALQELGWSCLLGTNLGSLGRPEPILVTTDGIVMAGFGHLKTALDAKQADVTCFERALSEDEALEFTLSQHCARTNWNAFNRICIALKLEPALKRKAMANLAAICNQNDLANLPRAEHIDVRMEIGRAAGVGARNVGKVKEILKSAHPRVIDALRTGKLSINKAAELCVLSRAEQMDQFFDEASKRALSELIKQSIVRPKINALELDTITTLEAILQKERQQPGSIEVRLNRSPRTIVLFGSELSD